MSALTADVVRSVPPDVNLFAVARTLTEADVGVLVVKDQDQTVGVVSERDVVRALGTGKDPMLTCAIDIAQQSIVWCDDTASVAEVAEEMMERYVRHVLVESDGDLTGVISARDLLGVYASADMADLPDSD